MIYWQKCSEPRQSEALHGSFAGELVIECTTASVGQVAFDLLHGGHDGQVIGATFSGLYLNFDHSVLFVSFDKFRSPLTLALGNVPERLRSPSLGIPVRAEHGRLVFRSLRTVISVPRNALWRCPAPPVHVAPLSERLDRLEHMVQAMVAAKGDLGFAPLLYPILGHPVTHCLSSAMTVNLEHLREVVDLLKKRETSAVVRLLEKLVGRGRGLTPSGDDLIVGLLLVLNRWPGRLCSQADLAEMDHLLVRVAEEKTTTLAAHLIRCAARGESDERLVNAVDWLFANTPRIDDCVVQLQSWGGSSGADSLVGMAVGIMAEAEL